jgi:Fur family ferric uptake transcriptional regulator
MSWSEHALTALQDAGLRRGGARRAVLEFLDRQDCCRSAQEIHDGIVSSGGTVGVASVYRTLDTLADLRLVQRVDVGDGIARFEPFGGHDEHHHHLVCDDCGRVEALTAVRLEEALVRVAGRMGYAMQHEVVRRGTCRDCDAGEPMGPPRAPSFSQRPGRA